MSKKTGQMQKPTSISRVVNAAVQAERYNLSFFVRDWGHLINTGNALDQIFARLIDATFIAERLYLTDKDKTRIPFTIISPGDISKAYSDYAEAVKIAAKNPIVRSTVPIELDINFVQKIAPVVANVHNALMNLRSGDDNGSALKKALEPLIENERLGAHFRQWQAAYTPSHRPPDELKAELLERAKGWYKTAKAANQKITIDDCYDRLKKEVTDPDESNLFNPDNERSYWDLDAFKRQWSRK